MHDTSLHDELGPAKLTTPDELLEAARPLMALLRKQSHPHFSALVTTHEVTMQETVLFRTDREDDHA